MLKFEPVYDGFRITRNGKRVFYLTGNRAVFDVGRGKNEYKMNRGSFKITEEVLDKKPIFIQKTELTENRAEVTLSEGKAIIEVTDGDVIKVSLEGLDKYNRMYFHIPAEKNERVYGGGEIFSEFNLRGKKLNVWVAEHINALQVGKKLIRQTLGIRDSKKKQKFSNYETYYAQPTFISSEKYFFHSESTARCEFDFTNPYYHEIKTDDISTFYIGFADDFEELMTRLTAIVGRQPELPDWVYDGQILGIQGGTDVMMKKVETALETGAAVNGVWIQDWEGRRVTAVGKQLYWNWEWDDELYPDLKEKIKELNEKGIKVLAYCNPFLAVEKPLYKEATAEGLCVKDQKGDDYLVTITTFPAAMIDLTDPDGWNFLKNIIRKNMIDFGFSGWMADFGEYLPTDCVLFSGEDPEKVHNTWPARWAKLNREVVEEAGKLGEIMFFTRAGHTATPKYSTMMWNGDNHVDFSIDFGLPSVIPAMLSLTCCGFGLSHSDIGGYTTFFNLKRSPELYMRWCEMNAFSPLMRGHEGLNPDLNAQFDANTTVLSHGAKMSRIHAKLKPYLKKAVKYNSEKGVGVVRPLFFYYDEPAAYEECYEYLLGRDILVCPVTDAGANRKTVYLPNDEWVRLGTGEEFKGGTYTVDCPIGKIPVFYRKNADEELLEIVKDIKL